MTLKNIDYKLPTVSLDKEQLATLIQNDIQEYHETTAGLDTAKKCAAIKKVITHYDDQRKNITRQWDDVKKDFMGVVKDALAPALEIEAELNKLVEEEKQAEQSAKLDLITQLNKADTYFTYFEVNPKWYNKTYDLKDIQTEIIEAVDKLESDKKLVHNQAILFNLSSDYYMKMLPSLDVARIFEVIQQDVERLKAQQPKETTATVVNGTSLEGLIETLHKFDPIANKSAKRYAEAPVTYVNVTREELEVIKAVRLWLGVDVK
jgi:hypothetical protein